MTTVLEIVLVNCEKYKLLVLDIGGVQANLADMETLVAARTLWQMVVNRIIIERIQNEVVRRKLLPVSIHTLCSLLFDALKQFA